MKSRLPPPSAMPSRQGPLEAPQAAPVSQGPTPVPGAAGPAPQSYTPRAHPSVQAPPSVRAALQAPEVAPGTDVARPQVPMATLAGLTPAQCNPGLSPKRCQAIVAARDALEAGPSYNTFNDVALICQRARALMAQNVAKPFLMAYRMGPPKIDDDASYKGGNCFATAMQLQRVLRREMGLTSVLVSQRETSNVISKWPSLVRESPDEVHAGAVAMMQGHLHMDLAVPMLGPSGQLQVLVLMCGNGAKGGSMLLSADAPADLAVLHLHHIVGDADALRWRAIRSGWKVFVMDQTTRGHMGINLLSGDMYVDHTVPESIQTANLPALKDETGACSQAFAFGKLISRSQNVDPDDADEVLANQQEWGMCRDFIATLGHVFGQGKSFVADIEFLMRHHVAYVDEVLLQPASTMRHCAHQREDAVQMGAPLEHVASRWGDAVARHLTEPRNFLRLAAQKVVDGEKRQAAWAYDDAQQAYRDAHLALAQNIQALCAREGATLAPLGLKYVRRLPKELLAHISLGLRQVGGFQDHAARVLGPKGSQYAAWVVEQVWPQRPAAPGTETLEQ